MIAYDDLVNALAAWRARQGLAETGADYLGPETPFPEYRVARPASTERAEADYEAADAYGDAYESAGEYAETESATAYASEYSEVEAVAAYAEAEADVHDVGDDEIESVEAEAYAEDDSDYRAEYAEAEVEAEYAEAAPADEYAISYDDETDAGADVAALSAVGDEAEVYEMDAEAPSTVIAATPESADLDEGDDEGATQLGEGGEPLFANDETTSIGTGIDTLAPALSSETLNESLDDELERVALEDSDSVSYGDDDEDDDDV